MVLTTEQNPNVRALQQRVTELGEKLKEYERKEARQESPGGNQMFGELGLNKHFVDPGPALKRIEGILA